MKEIANGEIKLYYTPPFEKGMLLSMWYKLCHKAIVQVFSGGNLLVYSEPEKFCQVLKAFDVFKTSKVCTTIHNSTSCLVVLIDFINYIL